MNWARIRGWRSFTVELPDSDGEMVEHSVVPMSKEFIWWMLARLQEWK
jgi:hypothetical protein